MVSSKAIHVRPDVLLLGPALQAVSGVSTHLHQLLDSDLSVQWRLVHFQIGSEGRAAGMLRGVLRLVSDLFRFTGTLLGSRPAIVHLNTSLDSKAYWRDLGYLLLAKALRYRVVYQVHGGELPAEFFAGNPILSKLLQWILGLPDVIVLLAEVELRAYREFVPGQRLVVIPNAIELGPYADAQDRMGPSGTVRLLYMGRLVSSKGIREAIEATARLRRKGVDAVLDVVGSGPAEEELKSFAEQLAVTDAVQFLGPHSGDDKVRLWLGADVFVFPTWHREGLPYALLESMAAGTPVVTTRVGAIPDVMQDGVHGRFVPALDVAAVENAVTGIVVDLSTWKRMSRACRERVLNQYCVPRLAEDFRKLYTSLTGQHQQPLGDSRRDFPA